MVTLWRDDGGNKWIWSFIKYSWAYELFLNLTKDLKDFSVKKYRMEWDNLETPSIYFEKKGLDACVW
jgi:hypothetical protein